jgi:hypothetical protein
MRFAERVIETGLGVGIALFFGAVIPSLIRLRRQTRARQARSAERDAATAAPAAPPADPPAA